MTTRARKSSHPVTCHDCRRLIPAAEPLYIEVSFHGPSPACPDEQARRQAYEQSLTRSQQASLTRLRAVFGAMGSRKGWSYAVFCHACKEGHFKLSLAGKGIPFANNHRSEPVGPGNTFGEYLELAYQHGACPGCGRPIYWKAGYKMPRKYCGDGCRTLYRRQQRQAQSLERVHRFTCGQCGELFQSKRNDAMYCSPRCRQRARRGRSPSDGRAGAKTP